MATNPPSPAGPQEPQEPQQEWPLMPNGTPAPSRSHAQPAPVAPEEAVALWQGWTQIERRAVANAVVRCLAGWDGVLSYLLTVWVPDRATADHLSDTGLFIELTGEESPRNSPMWSDEDAPDLAPDAIPLWPLERLWSLVAALLSGDPWDFDRVTLQWIKLPAHTIRPRTTDGLSDVSDEETPR